MNKTFGDLEVILNDIRNKPTLIEEKVHQCDCKYCEEKEIVYECSECGLMFFDDRLEEFIEWYNKCFKCKIVLYRVSEINQLIRLKKILYSKKNNNGRN